MAAHRFALNPAAVGGRARADGDDGGAPDSLDSSYVEIDRDLWELIPSRYYIITTNADDGTFRTPAQVVKADDSANVPGAGARKTKAMKLRIVGAGREYTVRYENIGQLWLKTHPNVMMVKRQVDKLARYVNTLIKNTAALKAAVDRAAQEAERSARLEERVARLEKALAVLSKRR